MRNSSVIVAVCCSLSMFACGSALDTDESRASANLPRALAKGDGSSSCQGFCGKKAPGGCWCDDKCDFYGDCCVDKAPVCDGAAGSCVGACGGKSKDGCWCDDKCELYGDCCGDEKKVCGAGGPLADCQQDSDCQAGLRCEGIPQDGSTKLGRCVDPKPQTGEGDSCSSSAPCKNSELICVGEVSMGSGSCSPAWMARSLSDNKLGLHPRQLPEGASAFAGRLWLGHRAGGHRGRAVDQTRSNRRSAHHADRSQRRRRSGLGPNPRAARAAHARHRYSRRRQRQRPLDAKGGRPALRQKRRARLLDPPPDQPLGLSLSTPLSRISSEFHASVVRERRFPSR
jgi:hypothetical protein